MPSVCVPANILLPEIVIDEIYLLFKAVCVQVDPLSEEIYTPILYVPAKILLPDVARD